MTTYTHTPLPEPIRLAMIDIIMTLNWCSGDADYWTCDLAPDMTSAELAFDLCRDLVREMVTWYDDDDDEPCQAYCYVLASLRAASVALEHLSTAPKD